jgi:hypothetical protein
MRFLRTLVACALLTGLATLAACSGSGSSSSASASQGGSSSGGDQSNAATQSAAASASSGGGDLNVLVTALTPPNSTQISRTDASGGVYVAWESTDSADTLKSFFEKAIPDAGMKVISTTNAQGTFSWIFAKSDNSSNGGSVTVGPSSTGGSGSSVILAATTE